MEGQDTTDQSISSDPGSDYGRNPAGDIVPVPEPRIPVTGPSVDKETLTDDNSEVEELVEEVTEQEEEKEDNEEDNDTSGVATG